MISAIERQEVQGVLDFWFGAGTPELDQPRQVWWARDDRFDKLISEQFGELHKRAARGDLHEWSSEAEPSLALVILLDQFSRNLHRGSSAAYANDPRARQVAAGAIDLGFDRLLLPIRAQFFYLPFMHSEHLEDQSRCVSLFEALVGLPDQENSVSFARRHEDIVRRFRRFPHRNAVLGRESTEDELAFLEEPNSSF